MKVSNYASHFIFNEKKKVFHWFELLLYELSYEVNLLSLLFCYYGYYSGSPACSCLTNVNKRKIICEGQAGEKFIHPYQGYGYSGCLAEKQRSRII